MADFMALLVGLVNPDTSARAQFEERYQQARAAQPDVVAENLVMALSGSDPALQQLAAVLLRRCLEDETEAGAWVKLGDSRRLALRSNVLSAANNAKGRLVQRGITHVVAQLSRLSLAETGDAQKQWPELFHFMFQTSQSTDPEKRESGFEMFSAVAEYAPRAVAPHSLTIGEILGRGLQDSDSVDVRLASLRALASLMVSLDISELAPFRPAIPMMLATLQSALDQAASTNDERLEGIARDAIKALVDIVSEHPKFLRQDFGPLAQAMIAIVTAKALDTSTRCLGLEFIITASEAMPSFLRKEHNELASELIPLAMRLMCEEMDPSPDMQAWEHNLDAGSEDPEDDDENELVSTAESAIHRLATALGGKTIMPKVLGLVPALLQDQDWRKRRTALQALSLMAEGCGKKLYSKLQDLVRYSIAMKNDQHPKVRYAAIHLVGRLCLDFGDDEKCGEGKPTFQKKFASGILPMLSEALRDPSARVATHAASALVNFFVEFGDLTPDDFSQYLDGILEGLIMQITNGSLTAKDEAFTAVSSIATVAGSSVFARYYDHLMPLALSTGANNTPVFDASNAVALGDKLSSLRGRALECAGLIAAAVGREKFTAHADVTLNLVLRCCRQREDETLRRYAIAAAVRVASAIKESFIPFFKELVPELVAACKEDFGIDFIDPSQAEQMQDMGYQIVQFQVRGEGLKMLKVNSSAVQEISTAAFALYNFANDFKDSFAPYAPEVFAAMLPLMDADALESIKNIAIVALPHLVRCVVSQPAVATEMFMHAFFALFTKLQEEEETVDAADETELESSMETTLHVVESLVVILRTCYESGGAKDNDAYSGYRIAQFPPTFGFATSESFGKAVAHCAEALQRRVESIIDSRGQFQDEINDHDEASQEKFFMFDAKQIEVAERLVDCNGYLIKIASVNPAGLVSIREHLFPVINMLTMNDAPEDIKRLGLCLLDDYVEFVPVHVEDADLRTRCIEICLQAPKSNDNAYARAAVWGLGVLAVSAWSGFDNYLKDAVQILGDCVKVKREQSKNPNIEEEEQFDFALVVDNALSALEKICRTRGPALNAAGINPELIMQKVIEYLPCTADAEEAKVVNVQMAKYAGTPLLTKDIYCRMLISQLSKGYEVANCDWEEMDAFLSERTRLELFQGLARNEYATPTGLSQEEMSMLAELGRWAAKKQSA